MAVRCRAPHGVNVVRKLDNPSCWRSAPLQGFISSKNPSEDMKGPRTHEPGKFVPRGIAVGEVAFAELFDVERISQIWLSVTERVVMCQFCARHYRALRA